MTFTYGLKVQRRLRDAAARVATEEVRMFALMEKLWPVGCIVLARLRQNQTKPNRAEVLGHEAGSDGGWLQLKILPSGSCRKVPAKFIREVETYPSLQQFAAAEIENEK